MRITQEHRTIGLIALVSLIVFVPFLGAIPLFDWDEVNFAEITREMILTGDYSRSYIDFVPFWEKPPLFFWLQAMSMHIWGINEFAARFPNAICGALTLCILYLIGRKLYDHRFGVLWVMAYAGSLLPHLYFRSGIIDPWFNLFIFLSLYFLIKANSQLSKSRNGMKGGTAEWQNGGFGEILMAGCLLGLAVLTKGPVAYLIISLVIGVYWIIKRFKTSLTIPQFIAYSFVGLFVFGLWYGIETIQNGSWFIKEFTKYQIDLLIRPGAGHSGFPGYHLVVLLLGCFPASILAIKPLFRRLHGTTQQMEFALWMRIVLIVVILLFSLVQSKIVHYSSLCYFPITFLATVYVWQLIEQGKGIGRWKRAGLISIALLYVLAGIAVVVIGRHPELIHEMMDDTDARASLTLDVNWQWWQALPVVFMIGLIAIAIKLHRIVHWKHVVILYCCTAAFVYAGTACWIGKVQKYSQGPASEFFQSYAGQDVYAIPWGYKSYSQYWDFKKPLSAEYERSTNAPPSAASRYSDPDYLLTSTDVKKDVYVVTKVSKAEAFHIKYPQTKFMGSLGGYAFFVRQRQITDY